MLVELKEIRKLDVCSFWPKIRESRLVNRWVYLFKHASGQVLQVALFSSWNVRHYVFTLRIVLKVRSGVAVDTGIVRRMVLIVTTLG